MQITYQPQVNYFELKKKIQKNLDCRYASYEFIQRGTEKMGGGVGEGWSL